MQFDVNMRLHESLRMAEVEIGKLREDKAKLEKSLADVMKFQTEHFRPSPSRAVERELARTQADLAALIHWVRADLEDEKRTREHPGICIDRDYRAQQVLYRRLGILPLDPEAEAADIADFNAAIQAAIDAAVGNEPPDPDARRPEARLVRAVRGLSRVMVACEACGEDRLRNLDPCPSCGHEVEVPF